ncbi:MAG: type VI secretion system membrane subunit TssM, partial [Candidatus Rokuibacteriota bacterium]
MRWLLGLLFRRWLLILILLIALALLVWWVGPTVAINNFHPFESETIRWIQIALLFLTPAVKMSWTYFRKRKADAALADGLVKQEAQPDPARGEVAQLRQRFEEALALLRKRRFGTDRPSLWTRLGAMGSKQFLYDLPWYVFIGAPGSGKTTALVNSGLRFPLADRFGVEAVRGVGGTRDCDWWFTDDAVFLDTAGRYTTQESQKEVDAGAWKGFLDLLKKSRPRRPINGVLVTVSVADLLQQGAGERQAQSAAIRSRIRELYDNLGVRFPIYLLVTKSDLLAGFSETFATMGKEDRAQVWGFSLPYADRGALDPARLGGYLEALERRLYDRMPESLEEEREQGRRSLMYGFPQQFALLRERLVDFVEATFTPNQFESAALLRGVYFTSGTQEGNPIDRVMGALARDLGLERRLLPALAPSGRSYFLTRLLREVLFPEAGLAGLDPRVERRRAWLQRGVIAASLVVLVVTLGAWWISYRNNQAYLAEVASHLEEVKKQVAAVQGGGRSDLAALLPALGSVRTLAETGATQGGRVPWSYRFGLFQGGKVEAASRVAYRRMLQDAFFPTMVAHLTRHLRDHPPDRSDEAYDALKTYAMLYEPKRFSKEAVWRWFEARRDQVFPGAGPEQQQALKTHFDMLYERGWVDPAVPKDDTLLANVRAVIGRDALPKRIYARLKHEPPGDFRDFVIVDKVGPKAMLVFERVSRAPLTKGVPALYTKDGFYKHFVKRVDVVAVQMAEEEAWVLGTDKGAVASVAAAPAIAEGVRRYYLEDYRAIWREFINDVGIIRIRDFRKTIDIAQTLSAPDGPLKPFVKAIDREVTLSVPPEGDPGLAGTITDRAQQAVGKARQIVMGGGGATLIKSLVDDSFEDIHRLAGAGGSGPAPVDVMVQQMAEVYQYLYAAKLALDAGQQPPAGDSLTKLRAESARLPEPMRTMMQSVLEDGNRYIGGQVQIKKAEEARQLQEKAAQDARQLQEKAAADARAELDKRIADEKAAKDRELAETRLAREKKAQEIRLTRERIDGEMRAQIADFCMKAIGGRYPFVRSSQRDVRPDDFARLFAPNGILDQFFQKQLAPHVDTTQATWRFRDVQMGSSASLVEFQRAQVIRDVFFRGGGNTPNISLEFKPVEMDAQISQFTLDVDGKVVRYAHGPQVPVRVQFPGPSGRSQVRVTIAPPPRSGSSGIKFEGPWALFR